MKSSNIFDSYYDTDGNLHIDARKAYSKVSATKNLRYKANAVTDSPDVSSFLNNLSENTPKLIIHHCDIVDSQKQHV